MKSIAMEPSRIVRRRYRDVIEAMLADCDVRLDGGRQQDISINDERALSRIVRSGSLGLGETYMDGLWDCERIDVMVDHVLRQALNRRFDSKLAYRWLNLVSSVRNLQTRRRARIVGEQHYDIGNDLFEQMLDSSMNYSCGYWEHATTLEHAQRDKMAMVCHKLGLTPGMRVLDIGCGWGGMAHYAAKHFGVNVVGITISREQQAWAQSRIDGLPVDIRLQDYRDVDGTFDRIICIGMFEHVGYKNYGVFLDRCHDVLVNDGLMLLHSIGSNTSSQSTDPWLHRYIFPNGMLPSIGQIGAAIEPYFVLEDWHSFGPDYDRTLMAWHERINRSWEALDDRYDNRFRRMWNFYLLGCAGAFRARNVQLWQLVLSKGGRRSAYRRPCPAPQCRDSMAIAGCDKPDA